MKRLRFTEALGELIGFAKEQNIKVILDWTLRDQATQQKLYAAGRTESDGVTKISRHQRGLAADIYVIVKVGNEEVISENRADYLPLHKKWSELGGSPMIEGDFGHFQWA